MPKFYKDNIKELKEFLYDSYSHDANLRNVKYDLGEDALKIELYNPIFKVSIDVIFHNIEIALAVKGDWNGSRKIVSSLTVEDDFSCLQKHLLDNSKCMDDSLYLLFQMFSGDEVHIVSREVTIESTNN